MATKNEKTSGLDGVIVAETQLSAVDGEHGSLIIRGHDVESIALSVTFEGASLLLGGGDANDERAAREVRAQFAHSRLKAFEQIPSLGAALDRDNGMDALRAALAQVSGGTAAVVAAVPVFAAAWWRRQKALAPIPPRADATHAEDFLRMVSGEDPSPRLVRALDTYLVTVCDHGMNASTFAARVVASTASDLVSAIVAAVGALKGPLHGGAPGPVLDMLDAIGSPERAEAWIEQELASGQRIMGMGHRIYRVRDPRAAVLEKAVERLAAQGEKAPRLALARAVERVAQGVLAIKYPSRSLQANVEFYTAVLLDAIGLPRELFSPTFATGRVLGWCAHFDEQQRTGRLIRPESRYVGPVPASV